MKIYILADMEGISGILKMNQVQRESPEYAEGCVLMMKEINAAVAGAFAGGATSVVVADTHNGGGQVRVGEMDERALYEMPGRGELMPSLDRSFDGLVLLGHHARAGTIDGFLDHTMRSSAWFEYRINGKVVGEIGIEAAYAGHHGVPVIMVSGDEATAREARATLGRVECAVVKWGIGRNKAKCLPLPKAHALIRETAKRAVARAKSFKPFRPRLPARIQLTFCRTDLAEELAFRPGVKRVDARTVRRTIRSLRDIYRW